MLKAILTVCFSVVLATNASSLNTQEDALVNESSAATLKPLPHPLPRFTPPTIFSLTAHDSIGSRYKIVQDSSMNTQREQIHNGELR